MDDKVAAEVEEIEFHQRHVANRRALTSPSHREKEMEISGRVLAAKRQADEIVAEARRDAATMLSAAHDEATQASAGLERGDCQSELERSREAAREGRAGCTSA